MAQLNLPTDSPGARFLRDTGTYAFYCEYCEKVVYFPKWCYDQRIGKYPACPGCLAEEIEAQKLENKEVVQTLIDDDEDADHWNRYISNLIGGEMP